MNHWRDRSALSLTVEAIVGLVLIAALLVVAQTANAGSGFTFNCWTGVTETGSWDANGEYDCATVRVGTETEEATPVETEPRQVYERVCRTHHREGASGITNRRTFCIGVNVKQVDWPLADSKSEALLSWDHLPYDDGTIRVYIDWIRLISSETGAVLKYKNNIGWFTCDGHGSGCSPDAYGTSHDSWYTGGCHDDDNVHIYAKARYKIQWLDLAGDPVGTWKTLQSTVRVADC